jgi:hypothetical protein
MFGTLPWFRNKGHVKILFCEHFLRFPRFHSPQLRYHLGKFVLLSLSLDSLILTTDFFKRFAFSPPRCQPIIIEMGNTSQKARHTSGDDSGPSLTAGRFIDASQYDGDYGYGYGQVQPGYQRVNKSQNLSAVNLVIFSWWPNYLFFILSTWHSAQTFLKH